MPKNNYKEFTMETVDMIASGYEWICPDCEWFNKEIEIECEVSCSNCSKTFEVGVVEHAYH